MFNKLGVIARGAENYKVIMVVEGNGPVDLSLAGQEQTTMHVRGLTQKEENGTFVKAPIWSVDNPNILRLTPSADGLNCQVAAVDPPQPGTAVVTVTDADDPGVPPITITVTIRSDPITHLAVDIDPPSLKTPA
jgi:hypothetical protein